MSAQVCLRPGQDLSDEMPSAATQPEAPSIVHKALTSRQRYCERISDNGMLLLWLPPVASTRIAKEQDFVFCKGCFLFDLVVVPGRPQSTTLP